MSAARLISMQDAAEQCGVDYRTVRRWVSQGQLNAVRVGPRLIRINANDLAAFLRPTGGGA